MAPRTADWQWPVRNLYSPSPDDDRTLTYADVQLNVKASVALDMAVIAPPITIIQVTP